MFGTLSSHFVIPWLHISIQSEILPIISIRIQEIIENDIRNGQYYVTGDLTKEIYDDNCRQGWEKVS